MEFTSEIMKNSMIHADHSRSSLDNSTGRVAVVGGGLSGLVATLTLLELHQRERAKPLSSPRLKELHLFEATEALGGRVSSTKSGVDLGGSWVWRDFKQVKALSARLDVGLFQHPGGPPDEQRIINGASSLIKALQERIEKLSHELSLPVHIHLNTAIISIDSSKPGTVQLKGANTTAEPGRFQGVLLCIPPRIVATKVQWTPELTPSFAESLKAQNTWMANMGKVALVYSTPWWRKTGVNINRVYPRWSDLVVQMLDGSNGDTENPTYAIVAFFLAEQAGDPNFLNQVVSDIRQLTTMIGKELDASELEPVSVEYIKWTDRPFVYSKDTAYSTSAHPDLINQQEIQRIGGERAVFLCNSETDDNNPGYLEGAVRAGARGARALSKALAGPPRQR